MSDNLPRPAVTPAASVKRALPRSTTQTRSMARLAATKFDIRDITDDQDLALAGPSRKRAPLSDQLNQARAARKPTVDESRPTKMQRTGASHALGETSKNSTASPRKAPSTPSPGFILSAKRPPSSPLAGMKTQINMSANWSPGSESSEDTLLLKPTPIKEREDFGMSMEPHSPSRQHVLAPPRPLPRELPSLASRAFTQHQTVTKPAFKPSLISGSSAEMNSVIRSPKPPSASRFKMPLLPHRPSATPVERPIKGLASGIARPNLGPPRAAANYAQPTAASSAKVSNQAGSQLRHMAEPAGTAALKRRASTASTTEGAKRARTEDCSRSDAKVVEPTPRRMDNILTEKSAIESAPSRGPQVRSTVPPPRAPTVAVPASVAQNTSAVPVLSKLPSVARRPSTMPSSIQPVRPAQTESPTSSPRKPSYPSSLGSGPLAKPINRVVSNPLVGANASSPGSSISSGSDAPHSRSPRTVSDPLIKPQNRRTSLNLETSKSLHGLSAALAKLQMSRGNGAPTRTPRTSSESMSSVSSEGSTSRLSLPASGTVDTSTETITKRGMSRQSYPPGKSSHVPTSSATNARIFKNVIAAVDVRTSEGDDSSQYFADILKACGAKVRGSTNPIGQTLIDLPPGLGASW